MATEQEIARRFAVANRWIHDTSVQFPIQPSRSQLLFYYGRYKQAAAGDNQADKPPIYYIRARYKWYAHESQRGKSAAQCRAEYCVALEQLISSYDLSSLQQPMREQAHKFLSEYYNSTKHPYVQHFRDLVAHASAASPPQSPSRSILTPASPASYVSYNPAQEILVCNGPGKHNHLPTSPYTAGVHGSLDTSVSPSASTSSSISELDSLSEQLAQQELLNRQKLLELNQAYQQHMATPIAPHTVFDTTNSFLHSPTAPFTHPQPVDANSDVHVQRSLQLFNSMLVEQQRALAILESRVNKVEHASNGTSLSLSLFYRVCSLPQLICPV